MGNGLEILTDALHAAGSRASRAGGGQVFQCPAHEDGTPSLSVNAGMAKDVVFKCHAGCEPDDVLAALGLTWKDILGSGDSQEYRERQASLWIPCSPKGCGGHKAAEYHYTDEKGNLLYAVTRCSRKGDGCPHPFAQWRPDPDKPYGKAWGLPSSARHVPYNLPDVVAAAKAGKRVFLMEGEKDSDRMKLDYPDEVATSAVSGAGKSKWKLEYCRYFKGASEVIIVADCDRTGLEYAEEVHRRLSGIVPKVRVVCSPLLVDGADFSDHRDYGLGLDDFEVVPFEPVVLRPRMVIEVEAVDREKPVVFPGFSQKSLERSLVGSMLRNGVSYEVAPPDFVTSRQMGAVVRVVARLTARGDAVTPETVALEIEDMGTSTYDRALPELLKIEKAAFSDADKPKVAARILRERTLRKQIGYWLDSAKRWLAKETVPLEELIGEMRNGFAREAEEYDSLNAYCSSTGDVFASDVLEDVALEEIEAGPMASVQAIRPQVIAETKAVTLGGGFKRGRHGNAL